ncbi:MAG: hypothetical protein KDJ36_07855 [Hyphomicrobiaceae bacterium]|nr:hypothetical protein [Hyphomicrobiaceae bacterium]
MEAVEVIVGIGAVMVLGGLAGGIIAGLKNRDLSAWIAWGFLFPPSLIVLLLLPAHRGQRPRRPTLDEEDRAAEDI